MTVPPGGRGCSAGLAVAEGVVRRLSFFFFSSSFFFFSSSFFSCSASLAFFGSFLLVFGARAAAWRRPSPASAGWLGPGSAACLGGGRWRQAASAAGVLLGLDFVLGRGRGAVHHAVAEGVVILGFFLLFAAGSSRGGVPGSALGQPVAASAASSVFLRRFFLLPCRSGASSAPKLVPVLSSCLAVRPVAGRRAGRPACRLAQVVLLEVGAEASTSEKSPRNTP